MRRVISLWLPRLPTDRLRRRGGPRRPRDGAPAEALVTVHALRGSERVAAADAVARAAGIAPGMTLADARALRPGLHAVAADPAADARALDRLADWAGRYTPWTAAKMDQTGEADETDHGLLLDVSGCAHLFGGEEALLADLVTRVRALGFAARAALADTAGGAWALAHGHRDAARGVRVAPGGLRAALAPLPLAALRLPADIVAGLGRLGVRRVDDLLPLPRAGLARRFGALVARRLDQALGRVEEPISPRRPVPPWHERLAFAEPIGHAEDIAAATRRLLEALCARLERDHRGARRLELALYRADGEVVRLVVGTSRPARDPAHLMGLFAEHLPALDAGTGVDVMVLAVPLADPLSAWQLTLATPREREGDAADGAALGTLVDRLGNRLGERNVGRLAPRESHLPERAVRVVPPLAPAGGPAAWPTIRRRPLRLLPRPEPIEAMAEIPDGPPLLFRWRRVLHRVARAEGPERIAPEWWREAAEADAATRDYFHVEDEEGRRFWLFRNGLYRPHAAPPLRWYLHGLAG